MEHGKSVQIEVKRLRTAQFGLPQYATTGSSGFDLYADIEQPLVILNGERFAIPTGLAFAIPEGYEGQIRPRSGLALTKGLTVLNAPGTIDSDYRGEVKVILINLGAESVSIEAGDRIAQMIISPVVRAELIEVPELSSTHRGAGGFGHSGTKQKEE